MEPESGTDTPDGLWRLGIFVEDVENSFEKSRADPMRLLSWFSPPRPQPCCKDRVLAICKLCLLNTFDHVHEYSGKKGVPLRAANAQQVCFPHVTLAAYSDMGDGKETVLMNISNFVEPHTGLTQPTSPTILLASPSFLASQGYFNRELVWVQVYTPLPLNQVILSAQSSGGRVRLTPPAVKQAMQQFSQIMRRETVLIRQDCIYSFPVSFSLDGSGEQVHEMAEFAVLECSPVQQGRLVEDTMLAVLPLADVDTTRDDKLMFAGDEASFPPQFFVRRKSHSLTRSGSTEFYHDSFEKSYDSKHSYITSTSASDLCNEADPSIEVATHPSIKLHRHYVILPKGFALQHKMTEYQPVLLAAEKTMQSGTAQLADLVLSVRPRSHRGGEAEGSHWALVLWYDGIMELERYVPPPYPGYLYEPGAIQTAYIHPYLLYSLFHETLSPTRRYYISFKVKHIVYIYTSIYKTVTQFIINFVFQKSKGAQEGNSM